MGDRLIPFRQIEGVVVPQDQADPVAATVEAARVDVGMLRAEMAGLRDTTMGIQGELALLANKADVQKARADLQARIMRLERWLQIGFGVLGALLAGLVIAALRYLPPLQHG